MMTRFRFINLFVILLSTSIIASLLTLVSLRKQMKLSTILFSNVNQIPFIVYVFLLLLLASAMVTLFLYYGLKATQREIIQKLQWLVAGNYTHAIFKQSQTINQHTNKYNRTFDYLSMINMHIDTLSIQLHELSLDLNAMSSQHEPLAIQEKTTIIEQERKRIASALHDSVSQQLYAATMLVSTAKLVRDNVDALTNQLAIIEQTVHNAQKELRALLLHLRPISLENKSLSQGLRLLLAELEHKVSLTVVCQVDDISLPTTTEEVLFRIVQELISNCLRHANATTFELYFTKENDRVKLRVQDNGVGFDVDQLPMSSYGLKSIKERVNSMGGQVNIVSVRYQGTSIAITL